ncbi:MAG TPA: hypothetical protein VIV57_19980 [Anaeromyxobacter sp.]
MTAVATASAGSAGEGRGALGRMCATFAWILAATVTAVGVLGAIPGWMAGESGAMRHARTIEEAERRLGARVLVPGYFPERLAWPPAEIRVAGGRRGSVRLAFAARDGGSGVEVLEATRDGEPIHPELLQDRTVLRSARAVVGKAPATISDVLVGGRPATELSWELHGRAVILRSAGDVEELFHMARSAHREGGR